MTDLEEFESWHEDLMIWERHQDELERIKGESSRNNDELEMGKRGNGKEVCRSDEDRKILLKSDCRL